MTSKKSQSNLWYEDACGAAHALELVGERWALLVVRELMFGPRRFGELRDGLPGISAKVLTERLEGLEVAGIVVRRLLPPPASAQVYELSAWGYESEPIFQTLGRWAARSPAHDASLPLSAASLLLSFRTMIDRERAKRVKVLIGLRLGKDAFTASVHDGQIDIRRSETLQGAEAVLSGDPTAVASVVYGGRSLTQSEADGALAIEGDRGAARRFLKLFCLPAKAASPK